MIRTMVRPDSTEERDAHLRCRNLVWGLVTGDTEPTPGLHCANRLGVVHVLDCPVYQGVACCLLDPRDESESPEPRSEEECEEIAERLSEDFLRWTYWRRVEALRRKEPPPVRPVEDPAPVEPSEEIAVEVPEQIPVEPSEEIPVEVPPDATRIPGPAGRGHEDGKSPAPVPLAPDLEFAAGLELEADSEFDPGPVSEPEPEPKPEPKPVKSRRRSPRRRRRRRKDRGPGSSG